MKNPYTFTLDTQRKNYVPELYVTQNDSIRFTINLMANGQEMIVSGATPSLVVVRADKQATDLPGTVSGNAVTFNLGTTETAVEGRTKAVVQLYSPDGRVSSMPFHFVVVDDPSTGDTIPSEREQTLIEVVLQDGPGVIEDARKATKDANAAASSANKATNDLTAIKTAVEQTRQATETTRQETLAVKNQTAQVRDATDAVRIQTEGVRARAEAVVSEFEGKIYGVYWDRSSSPALTRTDDAVGMVANVGLGGELVRNDFDRAEIYKDIKTVTDIYGNQFVRIPAFYIEKKRGAGYLTDRVSRRPFGDAYLPQCFIDQKTGKKLPHIDIGAFPASSDDGVRLESKIGKFPLNSKNIGQFRDMARANNTETDKGYQQLDIHAYDVITTLMRIEFATLHMQSVMYGFANGRYSSSDTTLEATTASNRAIVSPALASYFRVGQTFEIGTSQGGRQIAKERIITAINELDSSRSEIVFDGPPVDVPAGANIWNYAYKNGSSLDIAASSGGVGSLTDGNYGFNWRGIENIWGNIWEFVDGINISDHKTWVADDANDYTSNLFGHPYRAVGYLNATEHGYTSEMGFDPASPAVELPAVLGASATTYYSDYYYQAAGSRVAIVGGRWHFGASAGPFYWYCSHSSAYATLNISGRLLKKAL